MWERMGTGTPCRSQTETPELDSPAARARFIILAVRLGSRLTITLAPFFIVPPIAFPSLSANSGVNSKFTSPDTLPEWNSSRLRRCSHTTLDESTTLSSMVLPGHTRMPGFTVTLLFKMESSETTAPSATRTLSLSTTFLQIMEPDTTEFSPR